MHAEAHHLKVHRASSGLRRVEAGRAKAELADLVDDRLLHVERERATEENQPILQHLEPLAPVGLQRDGRRRPRRVAHRAATV